MTLRALASRLAQIAAMLLALSFLLFGVLSLLPGDPVDLLILSNPSVRPEDVAALKEQRGLDRPFPVRWWRWLVGFEAPRTPPRAPALAPVVIELGEDGQGLARVDVPLSPGESLVAPPGARVEGGALLVPITAVGVHKIPFGVRDAHGLEDAGALTVLASPPLTPPAPGGDGDPRQLAGGTDSELAQRGATDDERARLARKAGGPGVDVVARTFAKGTPLQVDARAFCAAGDCTLALDRTAFAVAGRSVRFGSVDREGRVATVAVVVDHGAVGDPSRFTRGALFVLVGDTDALGFSQTYKRPVWELLFGAPREDDGRGAGPLARAIQGFGRVQNTLTLMGPAMLLAALLSLVLGTWAAARPRGALDRVVGGLAVVGVSLPSFWIGIMAIVVVAGSWRLLPAGGAQTPGLTGGLGAVLVDRARHMLLPCGVLTLVYTAAWLRTVRASVLEVMPHGLVRTARAKGASPARVLLHALRNALLPFVTVVSLSVPALFSGALLTETVFSWPGVGRLQYEAILHNDSYVAIVVLLVSSALVLLGSLCADVLYAVLDPRLRAPRGRP